MKRALFIVTCLLAACGPHDVRLEVDGIPDSATSIVVSLALGNKVAPDLTYPITSYASTETLVLSLPERAGWISATVIAEDANQCDVAIGAGGIENDFTEKVDDQALGLFPTITTECNIMHTPGMLAYDGGSYVFGCDPATDADCASDESPQRTAVLGAFELDATEVTVGAYRDCVRGGACPEPVTYAAISVPDDAAQDGLTWDAAQAFCTWAGKTLPTEAQWEAAIRGPEGRRFPWGSDAPDCDYANFYFDTSTDDGCVPLDGDVLDERRYVPGLTPLGLADGAGNLSEWVADFYAARSSLSSTTLVTGPTDGTQHVAKGGSFLESEPRLRGASRVAYAPDGTGPDVEDIPAAANLGVRCAHTR